MDEQIAKRPRGRPRKIKPAETISQIDPMSPWDEFQNEWQNLSIEIRARVLSALSEQVVGGLSMCAFSHLYARNNVVVARAFHSSNREIPTYFSVSYE